MICFFLSNVLKHLASKVEDVKSVEKIDSFEDVSDLLEFPVNDFIAKYDRRLDRLYAERFNQKLNILKDQLISQFDNLVSLLYFIINSVLHNFQNSFRMNLS